MRKNGKIARVLTAMVTPFGPNLEVDYAKVEELVTRLVENGSDGIVVAGTTGESPTLTHEEKLKLFEVVNKTVGDRAVVIAGTGNNSTADSIKLTQEAEAIGVDGVMCVAPYYNKPPQAGLYRHFSEIAKSTSLPILVYNIPGRTGCNVLPETVCKLAWDYKNIAAVKEASGNLDQVAQIRIDAPEDFLIYSGDDNLTLPAMAVGADGIISVASHIAGIRMQEMVSAFLSGDVAKAGAIHRELMPLFKTIFITTNPIPIKAAMAMSGLDCGSLRSPMVDISEKDREVLKGVMEKLSLLA